MTAVVAVIVLIFFDAWQVVTDKYVAPARTFAVGIAAVAVAKERRRNAKARAAATTEAAKLTDKADGTIDAAHGGNGGGGLLTLGEQSPAAPQQRRHPPLPSTG